jgi:hypothetical protein
MQKKVSKTSNFDAGHRYKCNPQGLAESLFLPALGAV